MATDRERAARMFYAKPRRPNSWEGGEVVRNQDRPREFADAKRYSQDDRNDFDDRKASRDVRSGKMEVYAARADAIKTAVRKGIMLRRSGK